MTQSNDISCGSLKMSDLDSNMFDKQRKELFLLIQELKDRDLELNQLVKSHRQQIKAWELDRKRADMFERRNKKLENELNLKDSELQSYLADLKLSETQHSSKDLALQTSQMQMKAMERDLSNSLELEQSQQSKIETLEKTIDDVVNEKRRLEKKVEDLNSELKYKKINFEDLQTTIEELKGNLSNTNEQLKKSLQSERNLNNKLKDEKKKREQLQEDLIRCQDDIKEKSRNLISCHEKIVEIKDEVHKLQRDNELYEDQIKRKDDLIALQRSRQERTDIEIASLHKLFEDQQRDIVKLYQDAKKAHNNLKESKFHPDVGSTESPFYSQSMEDDKKSDQIELIKVLTKISSRSLHFAEFVAETEFDSDATEDLLDDAILTSTGNNNQNFESPTVKLQRILSESREMVDNLERTAIIPLPVQLSSVDNQNSPSSI